MIAVFTLRYMTGGTTASNSGTQESLPDWCGCKYSPHSEPMNNVTGGTSLVFAKFPSTMTG
jgi:hypothetical protein